MKEKLTEEQVYKHYEPNQVKAKEAIEFAVAEGRRDLSPPYVYRYIYIYIDEWCVCVCNHIT